MSESELRVLLARILLRLEHLEQELLYRQRRLPVLFLSYN